MSILLHPTDLAHRSALIIGIGGLGCPAALALVRAGVGSVVLCDDDRVDESNLHRQILFTEADLGRDKLDAAKDALEREGARHVTLIRSRLLPHLARQMVRDVDVVLEGADNFPTKFLAADACFLEGKPIIHGAAVRLVGTAFSVSENGRSCYRCLFEDLLEEGDAPNCSEAGVLGPVVGLVGALMADLALDVLGGDGSRQGTIHNFDGKSLTLRSFPVSPRKACILCGSEALTPISELNLTLYSRQSPDKAPSLHECT